MLGRDRAISAKVNCNALTIRAESKRRKLRVHTACRRDNKNGANRKRRPSNRYFVVLSRACSLSHYWRKKNFAQKRRVALAGNDWVVGIRAMWRARLLCKMAARRFI
jgi:hypothetical protein